MIIQSDFKDYYDHVLNVGHDSSVLYKRYPKTVPVKHIPWGIDWHAVGDKEPIAVRSRCVGFCGRLYPVLELVGRGVTGPGRFCYSLPDVDGAVRALLGERDFRDWSETPQRRWPWRTRRHDFVRFFEREVSRVGCEDIFDTHDTPVFVGRNRRWEDGSNYECRVVLNACLRDVEFFRVVDPFTAFQTIEQWFGNHAESRKDIPPISNEDLIESKGFDLKSSFRKKSEKGAR